MISFLNHIIAGGALALIDQKALFGLPIVIRLFTIDHRRNVHLFLLRTIGTLLFGPCSGDLFPSRSSENSDSECCTRNIEMKELRQMPRPLFLTVIFLNEFIAI